MASGFAQHYLECTTCDSNAEYHCNTCQFDLCQTCKETHQRKKKTENHDVVLYKDRNEKVEEKCCTHNDKIYDACCKECELPVCIKCIKETHAQHTIVEIEDIFNEKLEVFNKHVQELKEKTIPQCMDIQKNLSKETEKCRKSLTQIRSDLLATAQSIKDLVDLILKEKIEGLSKIEECLMKEFKSHEIKLQTYTKGLNSLIEEFEIFGRTNRKAKFIIKHKEKIQIEHLQRLNDMYHTPPPSFKPQPISKEQIERLFGVINEKPRIPLFSITDLHLLFKEARICPKFEIAKTKKEVGRINVIGVGRICHIAFQDENTVWVNDWSGCLRQTDMQGQTLQTLRCACNENCLHTVTEQDRKGNGKELINVKDWEAISVYKSRLSGDILVGMKKKYTARVTRYSKEGRFLQHIQYTEQQMGPCPNPHFITENKNGDVIATSNAADLLVVVVVDSAGRYRFSYSGYPENSIGGPWGVVTDILKNILICDYNNKKIHIINEDGKFLAYIDVKNCGNPTAIDIDLKHNVWVGFYNSGTIRKFRYLQEYH